MASTRASGLRLLSDSDGMPFKQQVGLTLPCILFSPGLHPYKVKAMAILVLASTEASRIQEICLTKQ